MSQRLDIDIPNLTAKQLVELKTAAGSCITEVLRRAVGTYAVLEAAAEQGKGLEVTSSWLEQADDGRLESVTNKKYFRLDGDDLLFSETSQRSSID